MDVLFGFKPITPLDLTKPKVCKSSSGKWHIWKSHRGVGKLPLTYCKLAGSLTGERKSITDDVKWCVPCKRKFGMAVAAFQRLNPTPAA